MTTPHPAARAASSRPSRPHPASENEEVAPHSRDEIRDRSVLDAFGRAIASPVMDGARSTDPYLPDACADDVPPVPRKPA